MKKPGDTLFFTEAKDSSLKMSWASLKKYREKSNGCKESRALSFVWKLVIIIVDSIITWGVGTLENRKGDFGSFNAQPIHGEETGNAMKPEGATNASYTLVS